MNTLNTVNSVILRGGSSSNMKDGLVIMNLDICGGSTIVDYNELYPATAFGLNPLSGATKNSFLTVTNASHTNLKTSDIFSSSKNCSIYLKYKPRITGISGQYIFSQFAVNKPVVKVYNYQTTVTAGSSFQIAIFKMGVGTISYTITGISSQDLNGALLTGNLTTAYTILSYKANVNATIQFSIPSADVMITSATGKNQKAIVNFPLLTLDGAIPFTNYTVMTYTKPANDYIRIDISANGTSSPITVTGLTNLTPYYFTVTASNTTGDIGNRSMITSIPTIPDTTVPDAPSFGSITGGNAKAIVGFTTHDNGGLTITGYTISTYTLSGSIYSFVKTQIGTSSPITVTGLTNLTSYYFDIYASNAKGNGSISAKTTTPIIPDAVAPDTAPTITTMVAGNAQVTVSYTAPTSNGGSAITSYTVSAYTKSGSTYTNVKSVPLTTATPSPIAVTGLTIGTPHYFNIYASNIKGMGISSDISSTAVTPLGPPDPPTNITMTSIDYNSGTFSFQAPVKNNGSAVTSYSVNIYRNTDTTYSTSLFNTTVASVGPITFTVNQDTYGYQYVVRMTATSAIGTSSPIYTNIQIKPFTAPEAPTLTYSSNSSIASGAAVMTIIMKGNGGSPLTSVLNYEYSTSKISPIPQLSPSTFPNVSFPSYTRTNYINKADYLSYFSSGSIVPYAEVTQGSNYIRNFYSQYSNTNYYMAIKVTNKYGSTYSNVVAVQYINDGSRSYITY